MAEVVQCDICKNKVPEDTYILQLHLDRRYARVGTSPETSTDYDICKGCLADVRLHITSLGWPEIVEK